MFEIIHTPSFWLTIFVIMLFFIAGLREGFKEGFKEGRKSKSKS